MHEPIRSLPQLNPPTHAQAAQAMSHAQRMYARTLSCWAMDVLALRRAGMLQATWRVPQHAQPWSKAA